MRVSPKLLNGIVLPWMERGLTCNPSMPDLEQTRMEHDQQDDEQVFS